jgi:hypothetical protein
VMLAFYSLLLSWLLALRLVALPLLVLLLLCHWPLLRLFLLLLVVNIGLHCDYCGRDEHVEAFCYRKKKTQKAQAHRSSQGTGGSSYRGSNRSYVGSKTHELLMCLRRLAASTSSGVVGSVTRASTLTSSITASQSSTLGHLSLL